MWKLRGRICQIMCENAGLPTTEEAARQSAAAAESADRLAFHVAVSREKLRRCDGNGHDRGRLRRRARGSADG